MARIHGRHGQVTRTDVSPEVNIGSVMKWTLSQPRDYVEVTCFGDNNKVYVPGLRDISGSIDWAYNLDVGSPAAGDTEELFEMAEADDPVSLALYPSTLDLTHYWAGPAYLDLASLTVDVKGAVTGSSNFKASGSWSRS